MLRRRLLLNLLPFAAILLATGTYAIVLFSRLAHTFDTVVAEQYRSLVEVQQMNLALAGLDREAWAAVRTGTSHTPTSAECRKRFEATLSLLLTNAASPPERALNRALEAKYASFRKEADELASIPQPEQRQLAYEKEITPDLLQIRALLDRILEANQKAILATSGSVRQITRDVTNLMIIGMAVALILTATATYQLGHWVMQPIQQLTRATRELAEGNLSRPMPLDFQDELGELALTFNKMAARLQAYRESTTEEIMRLHRTMETTLASFPDPIFVLNKDGAIELRNPAASELMAGLGLAGSLPPQLQGRAQQALAQGESFLPHSFSEVISCRVKGAELFFLPRILTMRAKDNALFGVAVVLYDVTRFRLLDAAKTHLVGTVSHELKTPLTSVRMVLHILLEKTVGALSPKQQDLLEAARSDTERLLRILNDLLDLARLEEGSAELHRENAAPAELLNTAVRETAEEAAAKHLKVVTAVEPGLPDVFVDRQRIGYAFTNILNNAIKHSPPGAEIRLRAAPGDDHNVVFTVADNGPGVPSNYHSRIFDRFFRVPGQAKSGAGLGLSFAREITLAHGGRIGVKSAPGQGATFYLVLNPAPPSERKPA
ncbi:MAG TPA: ATP-binding protein [Candidatus Acidoferrum sp.]|nr:ATP-binding protein [Candidatus Acidoferrum sp.]